MKIQIEKMMDLKLNCGIILPEKLLEEGYSSDEVKDYVKDAVVEGNYNHGLHSQLKEEDEGSTWYNIGSPMNSEISKKISLSRFGRVPFPFGIVKSVIKFQEFLNGNIDLKKLLNDYFRCNPGWTAHPHYRKGEIIPNRKALLIGYVLYDFLLDKEKSSILQNSELLRYAVYIEGPKKDVFTKSYYKVRRFEPSKYRLIMNCYILAHYLLLTNQLTEDTIKEIVNLNLVAGTELYDGLPVEEVKKPEKQPKIEKEGSVEEPEQTEENEEFLEPVSSSS